MKLPDRAVILAAGLGTRLKWLTRKRAKALMRVAGEPVVSHVIRQLVAQGVSEIVVNAHHHAEQLQDYLGDGSRWGCRIELSYEPELLDSGGGVKQALSLLPGSTPFIVHNADVLAEVDLSRLAAGLVAGGCNIALVNNPSFHPQGDFMLSGQNVSNDGDHRFTFAGISVWDADVFDKYQQGSVFSLLHPLRELIDRGLCHGHLHRGSWFDIGRPSDLMQANRRMGGADAYLG